MNVDVTKEADKAMAQPKARSRLILESSATTLRLSRVKASPEPACGVDAKALLSDHIVWKPSHP